MRPSRLLRRRFGDAIALGQRREFRFVVICVWSWRKKKYKQLLSQMFRRFSPHMHNDIKTAIAEW